MMKLPCNQLYYLKIRCSRTTKWFVLKLLSLILFLISFYSCGKNLPSGNTDSSEKIAYYLSELHKNDVYMELLDVWSDGYCRKFMDSCLSDKSDNQCERDLAKINYLIFRENLLLEKGGENIDFFYTFLNYESRENKTRCSDDNPVYMDNMDFEVEVNSGFEDRCVDYIHRIHTVAAFHGACCGAMETVRTFAEYLHEMPNNYGYFARQVTDFGDTYLENVNIRAVINNMVARTFCWETLWVILDEMERAFGLECGKEIGGGGGSSGGGTGGNPDPKPDPYPEPTPSDSANIKVRATIAIMNDVNYLMEDYDIVVNITSKSGEPIAIRRIEYCMQRDGAVDQWHSIYVQTVNGPCGEYYYTRIARTSGLWNIKAIVYPESGEPCETVSFTLYESCPDIYQILENGTNLRGVFDDYWNKTIQYAKDNKASASGPAKLKEYGCWIYLNTATGNYSTADVPGVSVVADPDVNSSLTVSVNFSFPSESYSDPTEKPTLIVANFHTHYPICWTNRESSQNGFKREVGPSKQDSASVSSFNMPGFVYDYVAKINYDHNPDAKTKLYSYGLGARWIY